MGKGKEESACDKLILCTIHHRASAVNTNGTLKVVSERWLAGRQGKSEPTNLCQNITCCQILHTLGEDHCQRRVEDRILQYQVGKKLHI